MANVKYSAVIKKYAMAIVLVLVVLLFYVLTKKAILLPQNINNLLSQNAYVFVLATGMLLCILTGGNIDLAVGSVVCFVGAVGGVVLDKDMSSILTCASGSAVEHHLAKVGVAGSIPVSRFFLADVAELAYAHDSGSCPCTWVRVQVPSTARSKQEASPACFFVYATSQAPQCKLA